MALSLLKQCRMCPRNCGVDRTGSQQGVCRTLRYAKVASFGPHFGEEAPLVGRSGSGTIFFTHCNLACSFCQNYDISHLGHGTEVGPHDIASMMLALAELGCHNINLVTPTHVVPQILEALPEAIEGGLDIPLVYNTGAYDTVATLNILENIFDIYMPDFKFWDEDYAEQFCHALDYPEAARAAIKEMHRQVGDLVIHEDGIARRGLLLRHLVMPGDNAGTSDVMHFLAEEISRNTYVNLMDQYHPCYHAAGDPAINRRIMRDEYADALQAAADAGIHRLDKPVPRNVP